MKKNVFFTLVIVIFAVILVWVWNARKTTDTNSDENENTNTSPTYSFANEVKATHFSVSTPAHASTLTTVPKEIVVDLSFAMESDSTMTITKDGKDYGTGATTLGDKKISLHRSVKTDVPNGVYTVTYTACFTDKTCSDGNFQFALNADGDTKNGNANVNAAGEANENTNSPIKSS